MPTPNGGNPPPLPGRKPPPPLQKEPSSPRGHSANNSPVAADGEAATEVVETSELVFAKVCDQYPLNTSIWDCCLWLGLFDSWTVSTELIILALFNVIVQAGYILFNSQQIFDEESIFGILSKSDLQGLYTWRVGIAHQASWWDAATDTSLARRVCNDYAGTISAANQVSTYGLYQDYLGVENADNVLQWHLHGPGLLILSLGLWFLKMLEELCSLWGFSRMLVALEGKDTVFDIAEDGAVSLVSVSRRRTVIAFIMVVIPRFIICSFLSVCGALYLLHTKSTQDIILNAIALSFVLEIDELLYTFAPAPARHVVENAEPVDLHKALTDAKKADVEASGNGSSRSCCQRCCTAVTHMVGRFSRAEACVIMILSLLSFFYIRIGPDASDRLAHAQTILCGGQLDFIYSFNSVTREVEIAATSYKTEDWSSEFSGSLTEDAVLASTRLCTDEKVKFYNMEDLLDEWGGPLTSRPDVSNIRQQCDNIEARAAGYGPMYKIAPIHTVNELNAQTVPELQDALECEDASYGEGGKSYFHAAMVQSLRSLTPEQLVGLTVSDDMQCSDLEPYCVRNGSTTLSLHTMARRFCPQTCKCHCDTAVTCGTTDWPFDRSLCPGSCTGPSDTANRQSDREEFAERLTNDVAVQCPASYNTQAGPLDAAQYAGVPRLFLQQVRDYLVTENFLHANFTPVESTVEFFHDITEGDFNGIGISQGCELNATAPIDLVRWAEFSPSCTDGVDGCTDQVCSIIPLVYYIFRLNLCRTDLDSVGSMKALCPGMCRLQDGDDLTCPDEDVPTLDASLAYYEVVPFGNNLDARYGITCARDQYLCYDLAMEDAAGDGWGGAELRIWSETFERIALTLESGRSGEEVFCVPADGCYFMWVNRGDDDDKTSEVSWQLSDKSDGRLIASGGSPFLGSLCGDGGSISGECNLWVNVQVEIAGEAKEASLVSATSAAGMATVAIYSPSNGGSLYEDVPVADVRLGGRTCAFSTNLSNGLDAFYYANVTKENVVSTEEKLCLGTQTCSLLVAQWGSPCDAHLDEALCLQPPGASWAHTLREVCPLACGNQDADDLLHFQPRDFCECETGFHNWCHDLNDIRNGVENISEIAYTSCFADPEPRAGSNITTALWCFVEPRCSKSGAFLSPDRTWRRNANVEECTLSAIPAASQREESCWTDLGATRAAGELPKAFACPRHCSNASIIGDAPWASQDSKVSACNEFLNTFDASVSEALQGVVTGNTVETEDHGNSSNSSNETVEVDHFALVDKDFCTRVASNSGCNCQACSACESIPWMVVGESPEGACSIDSSLCLVAEPFDNAHCEVFVRSHAANSIHGLMVEYWGVEEHWDYLIMNGVKYSGEHQPSSTVIPSGRLLWSTDSATRPQGFRMCLNVSDF